jgi:hypothetical protein
MQTSKTIDTIRERIELIVRRGLAKFWTRYYSLRYRLLTWKNRYKTIAIFAAILSLIGSTAYLAPFLHDLLEPTLADPNNLANFRSLFLNVGSALVGAAAIAFSFVMFAMQVNVERMPYGLFQRLSSDVRILAAFVCSFLLAVLLACISLISDKSWMILAVVASLWAVALILVLFLYGYRRALLLINPRKQLDLLTQSATRELQAWGRWAKRVAPVFDKNTGQEAADSQTLKSNHDVPRVALLGTNPNWTAGARRSILHAISFARRYAESGDHEVSGAALSAVIGINHAYVQAKGKTFFSTHPFFDNPLSTDGFINDTLEHLRQNVRIGITRGDEQQIEQTLKSLAALVQIYLQIDYSNPHASKTHAHLAGHYLSESVKSVTRHDMPDVVIEGVRLMGRSAHAILLDVGGNDMGALVTDITTVASLGAVNEKYHAVTLTGIEQLSALTLALLRGKTHDIRFAAEKLRANIALVAKMFLTVPELPLRSPASTCLAPYYSATTNQGFLARLAELVNAVSEANAEDEAAQRIIKHMADWADGSYQAQKELLLLAIKKRSQFAFDVINWVAVITKSLLALSNAPACPEYAVDKLKKHASWLIHVFSWIPDDKDSTSFVENYQVTETLFESAMDAHYRNRFEFAVEVRKLLLEWAFKAGKYENGWHVLERSLYALATLALLAGDDGVCEPLKRDITQRLAEPGAPDKEIRDRAARNIRRRAATLSREEHGYSRIDTEMNGIDHQKLRPLLENLANILSPETAGEPVHIDFF